MKEKAEKLLAAFDTILSIQDPYDARVEEAENFIEEIAVDYVEQSGMVLYYQPLENYANLWMTAHYQAMEDKEEHNKPTFCLRTKLDRIRDGLKWDLEHGEFD